MCIWRRKITLSQYQCFLNSPSNLWTQNSIATVIQSRLLAGVTCMQKIWQWNSGKFWFYWMKKSLTLQKITHPVVLIFWCKSSVSSPLQHGGHFFHWTASVSCNINYCHNKKKTGFCVIILGFIKGSGPSQFPSLQIKVNYPQYYYNAQQNLILLVYEGCQSYFKASW